MKSKDAGALVVHRGDAVTPPPIQTTTEAEMKRRLRRSLAPQPPLEKLDIIVQEAIRAELRRVADLQQQSEGKEEERGTGRCFLVQRRSPCVYALVVGSRRDVECVKRDPWAPRAGVRTTLLHCTITDQTLCVRNGGSHVPFIAVLERRHLLDATPILS